MDHLRQLLAAPALSRASRPRRLRRGIMALLAGMLLVTLLGIGAGVFLFTSRNEQRVWQGRQAEAARYAGQIVASFMQTTRNSLTLVGVLHGDDPATEPDLLRRLIEQNPALLELIHVDSNGRAVAGIYQDAPVLTNLFTIAQSGWFLEAKAGRTYLGDVQISADSEPYLIMAIPAPDGDVVAARLSLKKLWEVVRGLRFGDTGRTYVVNLGGDVLAHTDPEVALANTNISGRPEMTALSQAPNREWSGSYQNFEGAQVVGVTLPVAGSDWVVITEVSQHEARAISSSAVRLLGGGMLLFGVLITGAAARFLERMIFRPLEELRDGAERLGGGDLSQRIPVPGATKWAR